jgi:aminoglycoside phosphotransferase family enzyme/cytidylate kinase
MDHEQDAVIQFLSRPQSYGLTGGTVERVETHDAIVFLVGDHAYKLKRAVKYPYMDYSTPEKREAMCERELEINKKIAPEIYLEVRSILQGVDGYLRFGPDEAAAARDHVVVMRRFDQETLFGRLCEAGKLTPALMRKAAETIAAFHDTAEVTKDFGGAKGLADVVEGNNTILKSMEGAPFAAEDVTGFARASEVELHKISALLDRRRDQGRVRRCHGDLHLDNIFLYDGRPTLFDAIEFDDAFASIDVLYDLAFLLMDLEDHGARALANAVLNRYLEITTDYESLAALPLFLASRAAIRAHVGVSRANAMGGRHRAEMRKAEAYLDLARGFLAPAPPRLVAVGGLSGTGKTTIARLVAPQIGRASGAIVLRSDVTRKRLMGVPEETRLPERAYTPDVNVKVFSQMAKTAAAILTCGHSVVMDAVYGTEAERQEIADVAAKAGIPFAGLWLEADADILARRIAGRSGDASDATVEVLKKQLAAIPAPRDWTRIDARGTPERIAETVMTRSNAEGRT